jgi:GTP-binding protein Era
MTKRCGYLALLGRPNAGKSTLLNALVGDKIAGVSRKPQTTRNRILGVAQHGETQILVLDTPGLHHARGRDYLNVAMNKVALATAGDADLLLYLIDGTVGFTDQDAAFLAKALRTSKAPLALAVTKVDALPKYELRPKKVQIGEALEAFFDKPEHADLEERLVGRTLFAWSAKRPEDVAEVKEFVASQLPEGEWLYEDDDITDRPRQFLVGELIREQLFRQLGDEIPYGAAVQVQRIEMRADMTVVEARVLVARKAHKPIVLGKGGARIKEIGTEARVSLERHFGTKVFLQLQVGVADAWTSDAKLVAELAQMTELGDDGARGAGLQ